ncbi:hypothetical protein CC85DRAFT_324996 [Cutaneotrichosporon oleaginosum]|uniref:Uncharacterized protein n=1 Tax=Cutaneotrichosporon oleaginosum TaxID=879819 RepID=A0A0J0XYS3_9TREE|nr:uncharacterized protein CC85DRAFT_324996 [Cutaneotrichosporon oleaginosum]KLT46200.1 hypothetical protein CC85DRAFT_324996 [Cutaneotrichosporon oleaginosum]
MPGIDYNAFPHIVERIFEFVTQDTEAVIALRGVSRALLGQAEKELWTHVAVGVRHVATSSGIQVFPTLYAPRLRSDRSPIRLPLDIDFALYDPREEYAITSVALQRGWARIRAHSKLRGTATVDWWAEAGPKPTVYPLYFHCELYTPSYPNGDSSAWASNVASLFGGRKSDIRYPRTSPKSLPFMRFPPIDTPWSRRNKLKGPRFATTWLTVGREFPFFWGAVQARSQFISVHLSLTSDGSPGLFVPREPLDITAYSINIILLPPSGARLSSLVPATEALRESLATLIILAISARRRVAIMGQEILDIPAHLRHPGPTQHSYVRCGKWGTSQAHVDYWLMECICTFVDSEEFAKTHRWDRQKEVSAMRRYWTRKMDDEPNCRPFSLEFPREYLQDDLRRALHMMNILSQKSIQHDS